MDEQRDIVIAGGGMVGISLALELAQSLPGDTRLTLVEGFPLPRDASGEGSGYHPSFDARATALSYGARLIYQRLGIWDSLAPGACPIETIHVSSRGRFGSTLLRAADYAWPALGYVVENGWLGQVLSRVLFAGSRVEVINPARVTAAHHTGRGLELSLEGAGPAGLSTRLLVVADGASSSLRQQLGVAVEEKPYRQHALVANVVTARPHRACAFERFTESGPVAMLPLLEAGRGSRSALVWSLPGERAEHLQQCPEEQFLAELQQVFGYRLGRLQAVGERHCYPLALVQSEEQVRQGLVVMGNAAHALHPVAGQGFNLALRDVAGLGRVLAGAAAAGEGYGELAVLDRYLREQSSDQFRTIGLSDALPRLFMQGDPVLGLARDLALSGLDVLAPLKREFVWITAGMGSALEEGRHNG